MPRARLPPLSPPSLTDMDRDFEAEVVPKVIKYSDLWFQDGNIILQTTSPSGDEYHMFKCHQSVLSKHSPVFAGMFEVSNYVCVRRSEEYEGVSVISIPDAPADVAALLNMLYDPLKMPYRKHHPETISAIQGPLKLATKYEMAQLRKRFVTMLQVDWPSELSKYDQRRTDLNNPSWHQSGGQDGAWPHLCSDPARVICLAKDCDVKSVLPAAYYELGTAYNPINPDPEYGAFDRPIAKHVLAAEDWQVLMRGRDFIQHRLSKFIKDILSAQPPIRPDGRFNCHYSVNKMLDTWGCQNTARDWWIPHSYEAFTDVNTFRDPLAFLKNMTEQVAKLGLCPSCRAWMQRLMLVERQSVWDNLGEFYGVKPDGRLDSLETTQA